MFDARRYREQIVSGFSVPSTTKRIGPSGAANLRRIHMVAHIPARPATIVTARSDLRIVQIHIGDVGAPKARRRPRAALLRTRRVSRRVRRALWWRRTSRRAGLGSGSIGDRTLLRTSASGACDGAQITHCAPLHLHRCDDSN